MHLCICCIHSDVTHFTYITLILISRLTLILILSIIETESLWSSPQACVSRIGSGAPPRLPRPSRAVLARTCPAHVRASCWPHLLNSSRTCPVLSMAPLPQLRTFTSMQLTLLFHPDLGNTFLPGLPACGIVLFQVILLRAAVVKFLKWKPYQVLKFPSCYQFPLG